VSLSHPGDAGVVAFIVKADDMGVALANNDGSSIAGVMSRMLGRALVLGMPGFLTFLGAIGTAAMIWVGGSIIVHGLEAYNLHAVSDVIGSVAEAGARALPLVAGALRWTVETVLSGVIGLLIGGMSIPVIGFTVAPAWKFSKGIWYNQEGRG